MAKRTAPQDAQLLLRINSKFKTRLIRAAKKQGVKLAEFVRAALEERLAQD